MALWPVPVCAGANSFYSAYVNPKQFGNQSECQYTAKPLNVLIASYSLPW